MTDPAFPGRPDHPDFWLLSQTVLDLDAQADSGQPVTDILGRYLDPDSVLYMARQRTLRAVKQPRAGLAPAMPLITGAWMDGFMAGIAVAGLKAIQVAGTAGEGLDHAG
jgi:hypothetical protein